MTTEPDEGRSLTDEELTAFADSAPERTDCDLWTHLDWSLWGTGLGDTLREPLASTMVAAIPPRVRAHAEMVMAEFLKWRGVESPAQTNADLRAENAAQAAKLHAVDAVINTVTEGRDPMLLCLEMNSPAWRLADLFAAARAENTALAGKLALVRQYQMAAAVGAYVSWQMNAERTNDHEWTPAAMVASSEGRARGSVAMLQDLLVVLGEIEGDEECESAWAVLNAEMEAASALGGGDQDGGDKR
jgi:hypothetical protein